MQNLVARTQKQSQPWQGGLFLNTPSARTRKYLLKVFLWSLKSSQVWWFFSSQNFVIKFMHIITKQFFILAWNAYVCNPNCGVMIASSYCVNRFHFLHCPGISSHFYAVVVLHDWSSVFPCRAQTLVEDVIDSLVRSHLWNLCIYINRKQWNWVMLLQFYAQHKSFICPLLVTVCSLSKLFADTKRNWNCSFRSFAVLFYLLPVLHGAFGSPLKKYFENTSFFFFFFNVLHAG